MVVTAHLPDSGRTTQPAGRSGGNSFRVMADPHLWSRPDPLKSCSGCMVPNGASAPLAVVGWPIALALWVRPSLRSVTPLSSFPVDP